MATLNVYVPDALKAQMDKIEGLNWSQVAQGAWQTEIEKEQRAFPVLAKALANGDFEIRALCVGGQSVGSYKVLKNGAFQSPNRQQFCSERECQIALIFDAARAMQKRCEALIKAAHALGRDDHRKIDGCDILRQ